MAELITVNPALVFQAPTTSPRPALGLLHLLTLCALFFAVEIAVFVVTALAQGAMDLQPDFHLRRLLSEMVAWPITLWAGLRWTQSSFRDACPLTPFPLRTVPALLVTAFGFTVFVWGITLNTSLFETQGTPNAIELQQATPIVRFLRCIIIPPVAEQLFFAGFILGICRARFSLARAIWLSALLFALIQMPPAKALLMFPIGLWSAWLAVRTGSLLPGILVHTTIIFTILVLYRPMLHGLVRASDWLNSPHLVPLPIIGFGLLLFAAGGGFHLRQILVLQPTAPLEKDDVSPHKV